jgi:hypothetical protein
VSNKNPNIDEKKLAIHLDWVAEKLKETQMQQTKDGIVMVFDSKSLREVLDRFSTDAKALIFLKDPIKDMGVITSLFNLN